MSLTKVPASLVSNVAAGGVAATTVQAAIDELDTDKIGAGSPALSGNPTAPTASPGDNDTSIATTAFVTAALTVHTGDATDAHAGTAIGNTPAGNISASNVQDAINELDTEKVQIQSGTPLRSAYTETGAMATGTTAIPFDDTIPLIGEGDEYMTLAFTPSNAANILLIEVVANLSHSAVNTVTMALFQDATSNALAACGVNEIAAGPGVGILRHMMVAGTTSPTTFRFRAGANTGATTTFNGSGGARKYGGVIASSMRITEFKV